MSLVQQGLTDTVLSWPWPVCPPPPTSLAAGAEHLRRQVRDLHRRGRRVVVHLPALPSARGWADSFSDQDLIEAARHAREAMVAAETRVVECAVALVSRWEERELTEQRACDHEVPGAPTDTVLSGTSATDPSERWAMSSELARVVELAGRRAEHELARVCGVTEGWLARRVDLARDLPARLPAVWSRLHARVATDPGATDRRADTAPPVFGWDHADVVRAETLHLTDETACLVADAALERAAPLVTAAKLRAFTERAAAAADPARHERLVRGEIANRSVRIRALGRGMGELRVTAEASAIEAARSAIEELTADVLATHTDRDDGTTADQDGVTGGVTGAAGDSGPRSAAAIRADVVIDALCSAARRHPVDDTTFDVHGEHDPVSEPAEHRTSTAPSTGATRAPGPRDAADHRSRITMVVPLSTLLGGDAPAELERYGVIPAGLAREIVHDHGAHAVWRCAYWDDRPDSPTHATVLGLGRSMRAEGYRPPPMLREYLVLRDRTCQAPGCRRAARSCDLDHRTPYAAGGATCDCNLISLCRHHHRLKHTRWGLPLSGASEVPAPEGVLPGSSLRPNPARTTADVAGASTAGVAGSNTAHVPPGPTGVRRDEPPPF